MPLAGHAHVHCEYSPLDGSATRNQLAHEAARRGQWFMGLTNHGRLGGALEHVDACRHPENYENPLDPGKKRSKDERMLPILGIEAYWRPDRFMDLSNKDLYGKNGHNWAQHLCIHARTLRGWRTLLRLSSKSWVKRERGGGHYGKPCMDWDMLEQDHEDIIISTACISSPVSQLILAGDERGAKKWCREAIELVGEENFFFEIMPHDLDMQRAVNIGKINIAGELGQPVMVTGDVHVAYEKWADTQQIVMMAATRQSFKSQEKKRDAGEEVYAGGQIDTIFLSGQEDFEEWFEKYHPDIPEHVVDEAIDNTGVFAHRFKPYVLGRSAKMPKAGPDHVIEGVIDDWLAEGKKRREDDWLDDGVDKKEFYRRRKEYDARVAMEKAVIKGKKQLHYFYLVGRITRWAQSEDPLPPLPKGSDEVDRYPEQQEKGYRKKPIRLTCRGSAAGCLVSYDIRITNVDPIPHGMLFERFLNPDRQGMPDIDVDIESFLGRDLVKEFIRREQGADHVADIIAFQTFAPRAVIKAVNDVFDIPVVTTKKLTDSIGETDRGILKIAKDNELLTKFMEKNPEPAKHWLRLEDMILRDTRHAAGMLIMPTRTDAAVPTQLGADDKSTVTAWADRADFPALSDNGFIKLDILGVNALLKQQAAVELIKEYYGESFEPNDLPAWRNPYDVEPEVLDMFTQGLTVGVFQFAGRGITQLLRHIKPTSVVDLTIANALYRPGPIKFAFEYGDKKNGKDKVTYIHEAVEPVLKETLGIICFQEQIMELCKQVGNFTGGQADSMRKAVSKLYRIPGDAAQEYMQGFYDIWMAGCYANGLREEDGNEIWQWVLPFGNYAFNRSHAGTYALQAHADMFIKRHWPRAFYASLLTVERKPKREDQTKFLRSVLREAKIFDIDASMPRINDSRSGWVIDDDKLRYGFTSISGIGLNSAREIEANGPFTDFEDFLGKVSSGFGVDNIVTLAKAGAFDDFEDRDYLLSKVRQWPDSIGKYDVVMSCGCKKMKTVKSDSAKKLEKDTRLAMIELECRKHEDATAKEWTEQDPYYTVAAHLKETLVSDPEGEFMSEPAPPSASELRDMEEEALFIPMSDREVGNFDDFIKERVFEESEIEKMPVKPARKGKQHGTFCQCEGCLAAHVVIGGELVNLKVVKTKKKQENMAFADFAFGTNTYSVVIFPYLFEKVYELLKRNTSFLVAGHKDTRSLVAYQIEDVKDVIGEMEAVEERRAA